MIVDTKRLLYSFLPSWSKTNKHSELVTRDNCCDNLTPRFEVKLMSFAGPLKIVTKLHHFDCTDCHIVAMLKVVAWKDSRAREKCSNWLCVHGDRLGPTNGTQPLLAYVYCIVYNFPLLCYDFRNFLKSYSIDVKRNSSSSRTRSLMAVSMSKKYASYCLYE